MVGPLAYLGGKNRVARKIISLIPEHTCYIEPFCGGAQVFFHKEPSKVELLNDLNEDVFNFLRVCQMHRKSYSDISTTASRVADGLNSSQKRRRKRSRISNGRHGFSTCKKIATAVSLSVRTSLPPSRTDRITTHFRCRN